MTGRGSAAPPSLSDKPRPRGAGTGARPARSLAASVSVPAGRRAAPRPQREWAELAARAKEALAGRVGAQSAPWLGGVWQQQSDTLSTSRRSSHFSIESLDTKSEKLTLADVDRPCSSTVRRTDR